MPCVGLFVFVFMQSFLLSIRFSKAFVSSENLSQELAEKNKALTRMDKLKDDVDELKDMMKLILSKLDK